MGLYLDFFSSLNTKMRSSPACSRKKRHMCPVFGRVVYSIVYGYGYLVFEQFFEFLVTEITKGYFLISCL